MKTDATTNIQELKNAIGIFSKERGWDVGRTPRSLAISISLEAAELLEHFQWDEYDPKDHEAIANELADVLIYCASFADMLGIDIATAFMAKLEKQRKKYPVEIFKPGTRNQAAYHQIKQAYRDKKGSK